MGKPFEKELEKLQSTYEWAQNQNLEQIVNVIRASYYLPLLSVGSGGSFSAAELHATLHRKFFQSISFAVTPIELISALPCNGKAAVWFMSASGNNIDIRRAFKHAALSEPRTICALIGRGNSKLAGLTEKHQYTNLFEHTLPAGKDGFLATNSLLAFSTIIYRAYCQATEQNEMLPESLDELLAASLKDFTNLKLLNEDTVDLWKQHTLHVIYSPQLKSTAIDIESKFIEAGLGSIHLADLRNFAHGRHHWFSKNPNRCGILCLATESDEELAKKTLGLLPQNIPKKQLNFTPNNGAELIVGIILSMYFTYWRGRHFSIDPGRPGVPDYGSKLYRLSAKSGFITSIPKEKSAINRKTIQAPTIHNDNTDTWVKAYRGFIRKLSKQAFGGIILDYDGTLVDGRNRQDPPVKEISDELVRLLENGIKIGFATGRGKSIRIALQQPDVIPKEYWNQILIGYYNGSDISNLSDNLAPNGSESTRDDLSDVRALLDQNLLVSTLNPQITERENQITVEPRIATPETFLWESVKDQLSQIPNLSVNVVRSSHSIDILALHVSKLAVIEKMKLMISHDHEILAIGDRGRWPGNDTELLGSSYSLSVDEVSFAQDRCWNLCPAGIRGPQGTLGYLKRMQCKNGTLFFR